MHNVQVLILLFWLFIISMINLTTLCTANNIIMGRRQFGDRLLISDSVKEDPQVFQVVSSDIVYPIKENLSKITITYFKVIDNYLNGNDGFAYITNGGVGLGFVVFHFESQRSEGYNFNISIYGYNW